MSQGGQVCQQKMLHGFKGFRTDGFRGLDSGWWIPRMDFTVFVKNPPLIIDRIT